MINTRAHRQKAYKIRRLMSPLIRSIFRPRARRDAAAPSPRDARRGPIYTISSGFLAERRRSRRFLPRARVASPGDDDFAARSRAPLRPRERPSSRTPASPARQARPVVLARPDGFCSRRRYHFRSPDGAHTPRCFLPVISFFEAGHHDRRCKDDDHFPSARRRPKA